MKSPRVPKVCIILRCVSDSGLQVTVKLNPFKMEMYYLAESSPSGSLSPPVCPWNCVAWFKSVGSSHGNGSLWPVLITQLQLCLVGRPGCLLCSLEVYQSPSCTKHGRKDTSFEHIHQVWFWFLKACISQKNSLLGPLWTVLWTVRLAQCFSHHRLRQTVTVYISLTLISKLLPLLCYIFSSCVCILIYCMYIVATIFCVVYHTQNREMILFLNKGEKRKTFFEA